MTTQTYIIYPEVEVETAVSIGEFSIIGKPPRLPSIDGRQVDARPRLGSTVIGRGSALGSYVLVEQGARIGPGCVVETGSVIESRVSIGEGSFIVHGARVGADASIGSDCVIGGLVAERSVIGNHCRVLGSLIHRQLDPTVDWDEALEPSPVLDAHVFVATTALVIGQVKLSSHVYVVAGAVVTKDVPPHSIVHGRNCIVEARNWRGPLSRSPFWGG